MIRYGDPRHGTPAGYNAGCRFLCCRDAHAAYQRERKARMKGSLTADDARHGRVSTYVNYSCRCDACTDAVRDNHREYMQRPEVAALHALRQRLYMAAKRRSG